MVSYFAPNAAHADYLTWHFQYCVFCLCIDGFSPWTHATLGEICWSAFRLSVVVFVVALVGSAWGFEHSAFCIDGCHLCRHAALGLVRRGYVELSALCFFCIDGCGPWTCVGLGWHLLVRRGCVELVPVAAFCSCFSFVLPFFSDFFRLLSMGYRLFRRPLGCII